MGKVFVSIKNNLNMHTSNQKFYSVQNQPQISLLLKWIF